MRSVRLKGFHFDTPKTAKSRRVISVAPRPPLGWQRGRMSHEWQLGRYARGRQGPGRARRHLAMRGAQVPSIESDTQYPMSFSNGVICFRQGYKFFMIALRDQEDAQRIVREIRGLLPAAATA